MLVILVIVTCEPVKFPVPITVKEGELGGKVKILSRVCWSWPFNEAIIPVAGAPVIAITKLFALLALETVIVDEEPFAVFHIQFCPEVIDAVPFWLITGFGLAMVCFF